MLTINLIIIILAIDSTAVTLVRAESILFFLPISTKSHKNVFDPLINALAAKGHRLTVVSPVSFSNSKTHENITEIYSLAYTEMFEEFKDPFEQRRQGSLARMGAIQFVFKASERIYETGVLQKALLDQHFDLIFFNGFFNHCFTCLLLKLKAPVISLVTMAAPQFITYHVGNDLPTSFVPLSFLPYTDHMSFPQRFINTLLTLTATHLGKFAIGAKFNEINRRFMGDDCPSVEEFDRGLSMIFQNSFHALTCPRPVQPDVVEVGGMHCRPAKSLTKELDEFLSGAEHGFIYFSMGSVVQTDQIPAALRNKFLRVFSRMKQRVIWKWNSGQMEDLPENVRVSKWLPQQDILGHPKIRVFMTHGGLLSTQEAAYHGVPLMGIPIFADQDLNMRQAESNGYALTLEVLDFTEEILEDLLNKIIDDPQYSKKAKDLSLIFRDQMQTPTERAVYWAEYVMKHKGAVHLRSASRELHFFQYHSLDVIAFLILIVILVVFIFVSSSKFCYKFISGSRCRTKAKRIAKNRHRPSR